jgi:hypothetical protein
MGTGSRTSSRGTAVSSFSARLDNSGAEHSKAVAAVIVHAALQYQASVVSR